MEKDSSKGPVRRELEDLKKLYPTVFAMVKTILMQKRILKKLIRPANGIKRIINDARFN